MKKEKKKEIMAIYNEDRIKKHPIKKTELLQ
jgi:hypothetical protein